MSAYSDKLKDPRWQKKRLEILKRDEFTCQLCFDNESPLNIHHRIYIKGKEVWNYPDNLLVTLCEDCHKAEMANQPNIDKLLLEALHSKFLNEDLQSIIVGFNKLKLLHMSGVIASVLEWSLSNRDIQYMLMEKYWETLKSKKRTKYAKG
jgi:cytochrome c553